MERSKDREDYIGIPGRKMCRIEARLRGHPPRTEPKRDECWRSPSRHRGHEQHECWKEEPDPRDEYMDYTEWDDVDANPCGHTSTQPSRGVCPLGEDPWLLGILPDLEPHGRCPQLEAMRPSVHDMGCCGHQASVYFCNDCPQAEPPPPPPPPRKCCDRVRDETPVYQSLCPMNPGRGSFPNPVCRTKEKKMQFLKKLQAQNQPPPSCTDNCANTNPAPAYSVYQQRYSSQDPPYDEPMDTVPGYRPIRQVATSSGKKSMSQWVKIAEDRPIMNAKKGYPV